VIAKDEWLADLSLGTPLYLVGFEKDKDDNTGSDFKKDFGIKLLRGVLVSSSVVK